MAQARQVPVVEGLVAEESIRAKCMECSFYTTYFIFNLLILLLITRRKNEIWAIMIQNERSFSLIRQKKVLGFSLSTCLHRTCHEPCFIDEKVKDLPRLLSSGAALEHWPAPCSTPSRRNGHHLLFHTRDD